MAHSIEYKENTDTDLFLAEIRRNLPTFIAEHYQKFITKTKGEISTNAYISITPFSRLIAFLFPTHNGKFETNAFTSHFLGNRLGVPIIKDIINVLTSDKLLPLPTQAMIIAKITKRPQKFTQSTLAVHIEEFLQTLREALEEKKEAKNLIINILMSYIWEKSRTYNDAIAHLDIYPSIAAASTSKEEAEPTIFAVPIEREEAKLRPSAFEIAEEAKVIVELKNSDPSKGFPSLMEETVLDFGAGKTPKDCAEVTVRNFLNLIILNDDGTIKEQYRRIVEESEFLRELYTLDDNPHENLANDYATAMKWNRILLEKAKVKSREDIAGGFAEEMDTGFDNFIYALSKLLKIEPHDAPYSLFEDGSDFLQTQFNRICGKLSVGDWIISWKKDSLDTRDVPIIRPRMDVITILVQSGKAPKKFKINQQRGHAYIDGIA